MISLFKRLRRLRKKLVDTNEEELGQLECLHILTLKLEYKMLLEERRLNRKILRRKHWRHYIA